MPSRRVRQRTPMNRRARGTVMRVSRRRFASIVWLSEHSRDFQGESSLLAQQTIPWMLLEPAAGRAAFFSSGWENIHGIKPLTAGARWAFSVPFMVNDELEQIQRAQSRRPECAERQQGSCPWLCLS